MYFSQKFIVPRPAIYSLFHKLQRFKLLKIFATFYKLWGFFLAPRKKKGLPNSILPVPVLIQPLLFKEFAGYQHRVTVCEEKGEVSNGNKTIGRFPGFLEFQQASAF